jgi:hypothetical protein
MIDAHALDPRPEERCRKAEICCARRGKAGAHLSVNVGDPILHRDAGEAAGPLDLAGLFKFSQNSIGRLPERLQTAMVDDEVQLRPVLGGLTDIPGRVVLLHILPAFLVICWHQAFVDADRTDARFHRFVIEGIHQLLVI